MNCREDREERANWCWVHQAYWPPHAFVCDAAWRDPQAVTHAKEAPQSRWLQRQTFKDLTGYVQPSPA